MNDPLIMLGVLGFFLTWTATVITVLVWLNRQFALLREALSSRVPFDIYDRKHESLNERIRTLELWKATKNGMD